jgi:putative transposase
MKTEYYRHRPHIQPAGATLFVTFRLFGSLPKNVLHEMKEDLEYLKNLASKKNKPEIKKSINKDVYLYQKKLFSKFEDYLHNSNTGPLYLKQDRIAKVVSDSIHFYDKSKYDLLAYCIMSNHVHVVITPLPSGYGSHSLESIMHSIKSYSANVCNSILNRKGKKFWVHESYDHYSRNGDETQRIISYILNNPVKAGMVKDPEYWKWNYCKFW